MSRCGTVATLSALSLLAILCLASGAFASSSDEPPWNERVGTIANARSLPSGSHVYLDAEDIVKICAHEPTPYFLIAEPFSGNDRLIGTYRSQPTAQIDADLRHRG